MPNEVVEKESRKLLKVTARLLVARVNYYEISLMGQTIHEFCDDWNKGVT